MQKKAEMQKKTENARSISTFMQKRAENAFQFENSCKKGQKWKIKESKKIVS